MTFPKTVGTFGRTNINQYDKDGLDVSAGYNLWTLNGIVVTTVYCFPGPSLVSIGSPPDVVADAKAHLADAAFDSIKREISAHHLKVKFIDEQTVTHDSNGKTYAGKIAKFEYSEATSPDQTLYSTVALFCFVNEKWALEYRFTSSNEPATMAATETFISTLPWTIDH